MKDDGLSVRTGRGSPRITALIFAAALLLAYVVLDRWLVTSLGLASYSRVWQFYVSYADFGFTRRALVGTIFSVTGLNRLFANEYHFAFLVHHLAIAALAGLTAGYCIVKRIADPLFIAGIAFSPVFIIYMGYDTGSLDIFVLLIVLTNILFTRSSLIFALLVIAGVFTHELFVLTVPAQRLALDITKRARPCAERARALALPMVALILALGCVVAFGGVDMSHAEFDAVMRKALPHAQGRHPFWSGYFETASSTQTNLRYSIEFLTGTISHAYGFLMIPALYVIVVVARLVGYAGSRTETIVMAGGVCLPMLAALVGTDIYRWLALSAVLALLLTLKLAAETGRTRSRLNLPILLFCLLAPFGVAEIPRPFPMHQFVIERVFS